MKLYVINLDRSPERLARMNAIFSALGLELTRVAAVDGSKMSDDDYAFYCQQRQWPQSLTRGEVACFLSHKVCLQQIVQDDADYAAIFEDDVVLDPNAALLLSKSDWIAPDADIIKLETQGKKVWLGENQPIDETGFAQARLKSTHLMSAAYIISKQAAVKLLSHMDYASAPLDHFLFNSNLSVFPQFCMYQLDPAIVKQADLESTLDKDRKHLNRVAPSFKYRMKKIGREFKRIFQRAATGLWGIKTNCLTRDQWKRVKFPQQK